MHATTFHLGWWRLHHFGRNALVRGVDRVETALLIVAAVLVMAAVPVAGMYGARADGDYHQKSVSELATRHAVTATVLSQTSAGGSGPTMTRAVHASVTWTDHGVRGRGIVEVPSSMRPGSTTVVWLDRSGAITEAPLTGKQASFDAVLTGVWVWTGMAGLVAGLFFAVRLVLDRARARRWQDEWRLLDSQGAPRQDK